MGETRGEYAQDHRVASHEGMQIAELIVDVCQGVDEVRAVQTLQIAFLGELPRDVGRPGFDQPGREERFGVRRAGILSLRGIDCAQCSGIIVDAREEALMYGAQLLQVPAEWPSAFDEQNGPHQDLVRHALG